MTFNRVSARSGRSVICMFAFRAQRAESNWLKLDQDRLAVCDVNVAQRVFDNRQLIAIFAGLAPLSIQRQPLTKAKK